MGKTTGFIEYARVENPFRDIQARTKDYDDLHSLQPEDVRRCQAARCMNCGVPFCQSDFGCPLHNLIPEWNELLYCGQDKAALERLLQTAPFPEFTGRVCPALCEKSCNLETSGVTNRDNELYLIETGFARGWVMPHIPARRTGKYIAVIGSGPAGLAAADLLNQLGHTVTVIEKADRPGGLLMYGIPNMKLPKEIVERRVKLMESEGISFQLNTEAAPEMLDHYDAAVLCGGARKPRTLNVEHEDAEGICYAVEYLTASTEALLSGTVPSVTAQGKHVIVIGGGDTGNDCVATALRQHCASVIQLEIMPAAPVERACENPWPEWPRILRTDYGQAEASALQGCDPRIYETTVSNIQIDTDNMVTSVTAVRVAQKPDGKLTLISGTETELPCGLLLIAAGFTGCENTILSRFSLTADSRGRLLPEDKSHYLGGKLFSAGDMRTGQSLVVRALADGRAAAKEIDSWLMS